LKWLNFIWRGCFFFGNHRLVLRFAVLFNQVRPLRSSVVTAFVTTMGRSDFSSNRTGLTVCPLVPVVRR
jgi:hypothetical protein